MYNLVCALSARICSLRSSAKDFMCGFDSNLFLQSDHEMQISLVSQTVDVLRCHLQLCSVVPGTSFVSLE